jgi:CBS domain-containing protein
MGAARQRTGVEREAERMLVAEVMTRDVAVVGPLTPVDDALHMLVARRVTSLPVVDDAGAVVGILSEADLLGHLLSRDPRAHQIPVRQPADEVPRLVRDLMTRSVHVARPDEDVSDLAAVMATARWKSVPVVADGRLAGVVSRSDVLRALARPDAWLRGQVEGVLAELGHPRWRVTVAEGVATVTGPETDRERAAAEAAALSVAGVRRAHVAAPQPDPALPSDATQERTVGPAEGTGTGRGGVA